MPTASQTDATVFVSYSHSDDDIGHWLARLREHMAAGLFPQGIRLWWDDGQIRTGHQWAEEIRDAIKSADVVVLLVGPGFFNSPFIQLEELPDLLKKRRVLPLVTRHCNYEHSRLGCYQTFNKLTEPLEALPEHEQNRLLRDFAVEIQTAAESIDRGVTTRPLTQDEQEQAPCGPVICCPELREVVHVAMGVQGAVSTLDRSLFEPEICLRKAKRTIRFLGNLGSKWVSSARTRSLFGQWLGRIGAANHSAEFLLLDPGSPAFDRLATARQGEVSAESLDHFRTLSCQHPCLKVRLYDQLPCFRLVFIDEGELAISYYRIDQPVYVKGRCGWDAPQLIVRPDARWSLYDAFDRHYRELWASSTPLAPEALTAN